MERVNNVIMVDCFMEDSGGLKGSKKGLVVMGFARTLALYGINPLHNVIVECHVPVGNKSGWPGNSRVDRDVRELKEFSNVVRKQVDCRIEMLIWK